MSLLCLLSSIFYCTLPRARVEVPQEQGEESWPARPQDQARSQDQAGPQVQASPQAIAGPSRPVRPLRVLVMGPGPLSTGVLGGWLVYHRTLTLSSVPVSHDHSIRLQVRRLVLDNFNFVFLFCNLSNICLILVLQICAVVNGDLETKLRLHDTIHWVAITLSKSLKQHASKEVFKIGDIVEVATTIGGPDNLHAVSSLWYFMLWCHVMWYDGIVFLR